MISGPKERRIARYLPIDHCAEGGGFITPDDGEVFVGIPNGWYEEGSQPFIEVRAKGEVVRTVNVFDLSEIEFAVAEAAKEGE